MTERIIIFDTTLRDGEQSPGATMTVEEKLLIADLLDTMGVDVIEAGFAMASDGDFDAIHKIAERTKNATICSLARCIRGDIERAGAAVKPAKQGRIHTFISTSPIHIEHQLNSTPEVVLERITECVTLARSLCDDVEWSAMDATRSDRDYLCKAVETAINAGATTVNIPDTVGYALPHEYQDLISELKNRVPNIDKAVISVHCQNDLGLATANSLAAINGGARQIECTINGIGERAGNTSLEEVVMAIKTREDLLPYDVGVKTEYLVRASRMVSSFTGFAVQNNKAIVGANAFAHESGIHQDGMLKNAETYEIMRPESVGWQKTSLVLGKHSGRHAFKDKLNELGISLGDNAFQDAFNRFKALADKKKHIYDDDIISLIDDNISEDLDIIKFKALEVSCGSNGQSARVTLEVDGKEQTEEAEGNNGPVDALFTAIRVLVPHEARLALYQVHAVTKGIDAQAEVTVRLEADTGSLCNGNAADTDTLVASAKAYVNALNRLMKLGNKIKPEKAAV